MQNIIITYIDLLDLQREAAFAVLAGLTEKQIGQRPAPKKWCLGEILAGTERSTN